MLQGLPMRNHKMDNIKALMIFCVVFGHMLEMVEMGTLYRIIYSFHMPVFIFVSGYFARFNRKKIITTLIYPYFLFQTLYILFDALVLKESASIDFQFTTPYWLLWYLLAMTFYYLLLPFIEGAGCKGILFASVCVLSIAAGFDQTIGYYLTLSHFFTFLPYFVLGVILRQVDIERLFENIPFRIINIVVAAAACFLLKRQDLVSIPALYGSCSYAVANDSFVVRILLLLAGINWIFFFLCCVPKQRIPLISSIGKNTLVLFLAHGFIKKYMESMGGVFTYSRYGNLGLAFLVSLAIVLIFGNKYAGNILRLFFTGCGMELLWQKVCNSLARRRQ